MVTNRMGLLRTATASAEKQHIGMPVLEISNAGVRYFRSSKRDDVQSLIYRTLLHRERQSEFWALQDFSFIGCSGDIIGIIGANGAGKTTLCKLVSGLLRPDTGNISVKGDVLALLSLGAGFNHELSGRENILLNGLMLGLSKSQIYKLLPEIIDFAGIERFVDQPLKTYSTGMKARLGFSIAVTADPEILIVDEALGVGDAEFSRKAALRMKELVERAKLVIVVTHQLDFVEKHCTKALWIDKGKARAWGTPAEVVPLYQASVPVSSPKAHRAVNLQETTAQSYSKEVVVAHNVGVKFSMVGPRHRTSVFWPLKDISFSVRQGDILGVIGRNGAGKTTLCRLLTGILRPDIGNLSVNGEVTAFLTIGTGFNDQLTGRDNVFLNGMMLGIPKTKLTSLYQEIVDFSELNSFMDTPVKQYSRGMKSRLGFSIAATIEPDVFILDEALAVGDLSFYEKASTRMQELLSSAKAVIVVTHDLSFVARVCTRAIWIEGGTIAFDGNPKEAVAAYTAVGRR